MFFPLESVQDTGHLTCSTPGRSQIRGSLTPVVADEQVEMALSGCGRGVSRHNLCGVSAHTVRECLAVEGPCAYPSFSNVPRAVTTVVFGEDSRRRPPETRVLNPAAGQKTALPSSLGAVTPQVST